MEDIIDYEGLYSVTEDGRVWSHRSNKWLKPHISNKGYYRVGLYKDGHSVSARVHRLVAMAFIENLEDYPEINHIDSNRLNNNVENLEWCTRKMNVAHSFKSGYRKHWTQYERNKGWEQEHQVWEDTDLRHCKRCGIDKYTTEFYRNNKVNLATICKPCYREKYFNKRKVLG